MTELKLWMAPGIQLCVFPRDGGGFPTFLMGTVTRRKGRALVVTHTRTNAYSVTLHLGCLEHKLLPKGCVVWDSLKVYIAS